MGEATEDRVGGVVVSEVSLQVPMDASSDSLKVGHRPIRTCPPVVHSDANDGLSANQATANALNASAEGVNG